MSDLDVRQLATDELEHHSFPVDASASFRLFFDPTVHRGILEHARQDVSVEICGILVGQWHQDEHGPFALVSNYIRCESATSKFAEVTFTHESWAHINTEMDSRYEGKRIVGWYHSHPDFGIFLSDRDCFIHQSFFSGPGQIALVVDPVRRLEGVFAWQDGKPALMPHYWVGEAVTTSQAVGTPGSQANDSLNSGSTAPEATTQKAGPSLQSPSSITLLLGGLLIFLLGYMLSGWQRGWERQAMVDGVVANYTNFKLVKIGLREEIAQLQQRLDSALMLVRELPDADKPIPADELESARTQRHLLTQSLRYIDRSLEHISERYGFSNQERLALMSLLPASRADGESTSLALPEPPEAASATKAAGPSASEPKVEEAIESSTRDGQAQADLPEGAEPAGASPPNAASSDELNPEAPIPQEPAADEQDPEEPNSDE